MRFSQSVATQSIRRIIVLTLILSILPPLVIVVAAFRFYFEGRPLGWFSQSYKYYQGTVKDGDFWYCVGTLPDLGHWRIHRLDLKTGRDRETNLTATGQFCIPIQLNGEIYAQSRTQLFKVVDDRLRKVVDLPVQPQGFRTNPFWYDGKVCIVVGTNSSEFQLLHLAGGDWIYGREILLPGYGRTWRDVPSGKGRQLVHIPKEGAPTIASFRLQVQQHQQDVHLFFSDSESLYAYRKGFEFVAENVPTSALAPANVPRDVTGWEMIPSTETNGHPSLMGCDREGPFFIMSRGIGDPRQLVRRGQDGHWEKHLISDEAGLPLHPAIVSDPSESESYAVIANNRTGTAAIHRIFGSQIQPAHLHLAGHIPQFLRRFSVFVSALACAWLLHLTVLYAGMHFAGRAVAQAHHDVPPAAIASIGKRGFAFVIDLVLMIATLAFLMHIQMPFLGLHWQSFGSSPLSDTIADIENAIGMQTYRTDHLVAIEELLERVFQIVIDPAPGFPIVLLIFTEVLCLCCVRLYVEGRTGTTPGKRLMGIQVLRTTQRPAGFARILLRDLFYWIDIPFLVTPLPAAISMMASPSSQRIGDRIADTVVVESKNDHALNDAFDSIKTF